MLDAPHLRFTVVECPIEGYRNKEIVMNEKAPEQTQGDQETTVELTPEQQGWQKISAQEIDETGIDPWDPGMGEDDVIAVDQDGHPIRAR